MQTVNEWIDAVRQAPEQEDLIDELLADATSPQYVLLAGKTGIGKTNLGLHLAYCLATGSPFFGLRCQRVIVGYLGFEGTTRKMANRLEKIGMSFPEPGDYLRFELCPPFVLERKVNEFERKLQGCRVVVLDPLRYLVAGDAGKPPDAIAFITVLQNSLARIGAAAAVCHHIKKPNPAQLVAPGDLYQMKGAAEYADAATSVLMLERTRQKRQTHGHFAPTSDDEVTLHFAKHRDAVGELDPIELRFNREKLMFERQNP